MSYGIIASSYRYYTFLDVFWKINWDGRMEDQRQKGPLGRRRVDTTAVNGSEEPEATVDKIVWSSRTSGTVGSSGCLGAFVKA